MIIADAALVWCPFPDRDIARSLSTRLLEEKLISCANILPDIEALFEWEDEISSATEVGVLFKTSAQKLGELVTRLGDVHPYDTPAIVGWRCDTAHPATLRWLSETLAMN